MLPSPQQNKPVDNHIKGEDGSMPSINTGQQSDGSIVENDVESVFEIQNTESTVVEEGDTISETSEFTESSCTSKCSCESLCV